MNLSQSVKESLKELIALTGDDIQEVEIEKRFFGWRVRVSKRGANTVVQAVPASASAPNLSASADDDAPATGPTVKSPMVGTFYRAPSPDAEPFAMEGDVVSVGQTVCIIEAMKIMNEIEAEVAGRVSKVLVENGASVEYDTPLFLIDPS